VNLAHKGEILMTLFNLMHKLESSDNIFAKVFSSNIILYKYNDRETNDFQEGMVSIGQVDYDIIDDAVTNPHIDLDNDTLTADDKAVLKEVFNL
jgi:hypothetical protein